jgi:1,2-phenylacetyl-CoA epoxidase PaaB subunit
LFSRTAQELAGETSSIMLAFEPNDVHERYAVFVKVKQKESCIFRGTVFAGSPPGALREALVSLPDQAALWWWVIPEREISKTELTENESLFEPASRKVFRHQSSFNTLTLMRQIESDPSRRGEEDDDRES